MQGLIFRVALGEATIGRQLIHVCTENWKSDVPEVELR